MFFSEYSILSIFFIAAIASLITLLLRISDNYLKLFSVIPSPLAAWRAICSQLVAKLDKTGRSSMALRMRGRIMALALIAFSALIGNILETFLQNMQNIYIDVALLAFALLALPTKPSNDSKDASGKLREQVESGSIMLLQRIVAPITGWILFGWAGVFMMITIVNLLNSAASAQKAFYLPINKLGKIFLFIPVIFASCLIFTAALFTSKGRPLPALRAGLEKMLTPNIAIVYCVAEALSLSLAGPKSQYSKLLGSKWLGSGTARLQQPDLKRWNWLLNISQFMLIAILTSLSLLL